MVDCKGKELHIGDEVVYIKGKNSLSELEIGRITKFYKNNRNEDECSVGSQSHLLSFRVFKI